MNENLQQVRSRQTAPLEAAGFSLYRGWNDELAAQLVENSRESEILKWVPHDASERFSDMETANRWHAQDKRSVYALRDDENSLVGIAWFTAHARPELQAEYTFAIRMYEKARGRGLAGAFVAAVHDDFTTCENYQGAFWLETDKTNERARKLYEKSGYEKISTVSDRVLMVRK